MNVNELLSCVEPFDEIIGGLSAARKDLSPEIAKRKISTITNDSTKVSPDSIFVAISGTEVDSHEFIAQARSQGAACIIGEYSQGQNVPDVIVGDTRAILGPLGAALYDFPTSKMKIAGVTGTNGKTTISYLYSSIAEHEKLHNFTMGTTGILLDFETQADSQTTPDPLILQSTFADFLSRDITNGAIEVSSHALDQHRVLGSQFCVVGFSNMSQDHLDYHVTMQNYVNAKLKLFSKVYSSHAVINLDGDKSEFFIKHATNGNLDITTVSCLDRNADIYIEQLSMDLSGSLLNVMHKKSGKTVELKTPMFGTFNHENIAVALGMAMVAGFDLARSCKALENPFVVPGRLERAKADKDFEVFVDYAHTPDALQRVLKTMRPLAKRLIVVFGCGGDRDKEKRPLMGEIAESLADIAIVTSDNPRSEDPNQIIDDIKKGMSGEVISEPDRKKAITKALELAQSGDAIIVAGKGHERGQIFADRVDDFYDMDVICESLRELKVTSDFQKR